MQTPREYKPHSSQSTGLIVSQNRIITYTSIKILVQAHEDGTNTSSPKIYIIVERISSTETKTSLNGMITYDTTHTDSALLLSASSTDTSPYYKWMFCAPDEARPYHFSVAYPNFAMNSGKSILAHSVHFSKHSAGEEFDSHVSS